MCNLLDFKLAEILSIKKEPNEKFRIKNYRNQIRTHEMNSVAKGNVKEKNQ